MLSGGSTAREGAGLVWLRNPRFFGFAAHGGGSADPLPQPPHVGAVAELEKLGKQRLTEHCYFCYAPSLGMRPEGAAPPCPPARGGRHAGAAGKKDAAKAFLFS